MSEETKHMTLEKARDVLKEFEAYKVFPLFWLDRDQNGRWSAMTTAESKGFLDCHAAHQEEIAKYKETIKELGQAIEEIATHPALVTGTASSKNIPASLIARIKEALAKASAIKL